MGTLNVNILYFAHVREKVGLPREALTLPAAASVADVIAAIVALHPAVEPLLPSVRVALDGEFVGPEAPLRDGAELVLIPPVAGGSGGGEALSPPPALPPVALHEAPLEGLAPALEALVAGPDRGAVVTFHGRVRDHARGQAVSRLEYEAYPSMALSQMRRIVAEVEATIPGATCAMHHRVGALDVGEVAVIAVAAHAHRVPAFEACRLLIERLKQDVPIWKRETGPDGASWVSDRP